MSNKILVAYFSATGRTEKTAKALAAAAGAELYAIRPKEPYTAADLDWTNRQSRSSKEMSDGFSRPPLSDMGAPISVSDVIFLGFPIWWYTAPTIIKTFLESYDFSGKKIVLFATSGGSGLGKTESDLRPCAPGAVFMGGKRLSGADESSLKSWVESLKL